MFLIALWLLLRRQPRHRRGTLDGKALLFGIWMTPWLLLSGSVRSAWPFFIALAVWIVGALVIRARHNYVETK
jgi:hypothetical protein